VNDKHCEQLSALVDGELDADASKFLLRRVASDTTLVHRFERYVMIGEALRGTPVSGNGMAARVRAALASEGGQTDEALAAATPTPARSGWHGGLRPIATVAAAAAVAAVAVFALLPQRDIGQPGAGNASGPRVVAEPPPPPLETVPDVREDGELLLAPLPGQASFASYLLKHNGVPETSVSPIFITDELIYPDIADVAANAQDALSDEGARPGERTSDEPRR
jgi:hypothetical protein